MGKPFEKRGKKSPIIVRPAPTRPRSATELQRQLLDRCVEISKAGNAFAAIDALRIASATGLALPADLVEIAVQAIATLAMKNGYLKKYRTDMIDYARWSLVQELRDRRPELAEHVELRWD